MEDLRNRTSENERLEMQATTVTGQVEALRELADARELEVKEQREKLARYTGANAVFVFCFPRSIGKGACDQSLFFLPEVLYMGVCNGCSQKKFLGDLVELF